MGLFDVLGRMARGEPGFQDDEAKPEEPQKASSEPSGASEPAIRKDDDTTFPVVCIRQAKPHLDGTNLDLYCQIENTWLHEIELDKIHIFNVKRELDATLRPGEVREFLVYKGPALAHEYHEAQLDYKTKDGDYFATIHEVNFSYNPQDKTYLPGDIHLREPVRDIYG